MTGSRVTRLRGGVTRKPSIGAESYAVTQLHGAYTCVRVRAGVQVRVCVQVCRCVCACACVCVRCARNRETA